MTNILILDDSTELLKMLEIIFKMNGHNARTTSTKQMFLVELENAVPDIILIDVHLGDIDGRDICKELKEKEESKNIPVILISASPNKLQDYKECDADDIVEKPFNIKDLMDKVEPLIYSSKGSTANS